MPRLPCHQHLTSPLLVRPDDARPCGVLCAAVDFCARPERLLLPPSEEPPALPAGLDSGDLRPVLTAVHGAVVAALH